KKDTATDVVTTKCKIKKLVILAATIDPGANFPIITEDIVKHLKFVINTKEKHNLSGIVTSPTELIGIIHNVLVTFTLGELATTSQDTNTSIPDQISQNVDSDDNNTALKKNT
ncbi:4437_t:CDS:2, partial [Cetraspora pellucida]